MVLLIIINEGKIINDCTPKINNILHKFVHHKQTLYSEKGSKKSYYEKHLIWNSKKIHKDL